MSARLLVGVAQAVERNEPRQYVIDLTTGLATLGVPAQVALLRDGPVRHDLAAVADVRVMEHLRPRSPAAMAESLARRVSPAAARQIRGLRTADRRRWVQAPEVVHLNGPQAVPLLNYVDGRRVTVTTYVHPLDLGVAELAPVDRDLLIACTDRYLAADEATADELSRIEGIDPARVELAPVPLIFPRPSLAESVRADARRRIGLPATGVVIGVPPVPDWMQAPDLTVALAWELQQRKGDETPHILWFGGPPDERRRWPIEHDLRRTGLADTVHLVDPLPPGTDALDLVDLVVLPSRTSAPIDEQFVKQAAAHGVPVLGWSASPVSAALTEWTGELIQQPDVGAMTSRVLELVDGVGTRLDLARQGRARLVHDIDRLAPVGLEP